jgi:hypothetical protein
MKVKTSELEGAALDWAVAKCEVSDVGEIDDPHFYSTDWAQGGPIIEREMIDIRHIRTLPKFFWEAYTPAPEHEDGEVCAEGHAPLIAAMRCYVASKLGGTVEIPEELV